MVVIVSGPPARTKPPCTIVRFPPINTPPVAARSPVELHVRLPCSLSDRGEPHADTQHSDSREVAGNIHGRCDSHRLVRQDDGVSHYVSASEWDARKSRLRRQHSRAVRVEPILRCSKKSLARNSVKRGRSSNPLTCQLTPSALNAM